MQKSPRENDRTTYYRSLELKQTRKQLTQIETAYNELYQLYGDLMDSRAFLYAVIAPEGAILTMNMGMKIFLGYDLGLGMSENTLFEFCLFSQMDTLKGLLHDALITPVTALIPLMRRSGEQVWMEVEFAPTEFDGREAVQLTGTDVTDWKNLTKLQANVDNADETESTPDGENSGGLESILSNSLGTPLQIQRHEEKWSNILDSCPGLLCCVVDQAGRLIYASQGYRAMVQRVLGHDCIIGTYYPPQRSSTDRALHSLLSGIMLGGTDGIEITEYHDDPEQSEIQWTFTAAPLKIENVISGAVFYVSRSTPDSNANTQNVAPTPAPSSTSSVDSAGLLDALAVRAAVIDDQGVCLAANSSFMQSLQSQDNETSASNVSVTSVAGKKILDMIPKDTANKKFHRDFVGILASAIVHGENGAVARLEYRLADNQGELTWFEVQVKPITWDGKKAALLTCSDITELHRTREQLKRALEVDRTTEMLNRQGMERLLTQEVERVIRKSRKAGEPQTLSLIILDIDGFRQINAEHGYAATDRALKVLTETLRGVPTDSEVNALAIGRWGGDEFMLLVRRSETEALVLANSLHDRLNASSGLKMTLSIGVAEFKIEAGMDVSGFIAAAFDAMMTAKRNGGNQTVCASSADSTPVPA